MFGCPIQLAFPKKKNKKDKNLSDIFSNNDINSYKLLMNDFNDCNDFNDFNNRSINDEQNYKKVQMNNKMIEAKMIEDKIVEDKIVEDKIVKDKMIEEKIDENNEKLKQIIEGINYKVDQLSQKIDIEGKNIYPLSNEPLYNNNKPLIEEFNIYTETINDFFLYLLYGLLSIYIIDYFYRLGQKSY